MSTDLRYSFEVFPPRSVEGADILAKVRQELTVFNPDFFSVTFGAGGGKQQQRSLEAVRLFVSQGAVVTPHISCVAMTRRRLRELLAHYQELGIRSLLVIKGDCPEGDEPQPSDFFYASELVSAIRDLTESRFRIIVAAYPEFHPAARNPAADIEYFKKKVEAGADGAITQLFFNTDAYCRFVEECGKNGIHIPIVPGIAPIRNYAKLVKFAAACGAEIPLWLGKYLAMYSGDPDSLQKFGVDFVTGMCQKLRSYGADAMHFYTFNQTDPTRSVVKNLAQASTGDLILNA